MGRTVRAGAAAVKESRRGHFHIDKYGVRWYTNRAVSNPTRITNSLIGSRRKGIEWHETISFRFKVRWWKPLPAVISEYKATKATRSSLASAGDCDASTSKSSPVTV